MLYEVLEHVLDLNLSYAPLRHTSAGMIRTVQLHSQRSLAMRSRSLPTFGD